MMTETHRLERGEMSKYPRPVTDLVLYLVNDQMIRYKWVDGDHIALYPPDGLGRPFKISPKRPAEIQVEFIERQFMRRNSIPGPDGVVPGTDMRTVETVSLSGEELSTEEPQGAQIAPTVPGAMEAIRTLAASLGVTLDGVSEEDFLAVVAEKDACQARAEELAEEVEELRNEVTAWQESMQHMTAQRDHLLEQIDAAKAALGWIA